MLDQTIEEAFVQQSVEFYSFTIAKASLSSQNSQSVHLQPPSPTHSILSTTSLLVSQTVIPTILVVIKTTPPLGPSSSQSSRIVMVDRYEPLVLPGQLNAMPGD